MDKGAGFTPRLDILPLPQRRLWDELAGVPPEFVLYGGTAIALHLGHRVSLDFDFFGNRHFDPAKLVSEVPFMANAQITQRAPNTLTGIVDRDGLVKVSFFGVAELPRLVTPHQAPDNGLQVASLLDLAGMKASVVQVRAEAKDYIDIDALMTQGGIALPSALAAGRAIYGRQFNPQITLKALSFFDDGDLRQLPAACKQRLAMAAREVDLDQLPDIGVRTLDPQCDWKLRP
jgi:Nucleotidyl transferase AbiEii toxin, Type IV TA system